MERWKTNKQIKTRHITSDTINLQVKIKGGNSGEEKKKSLYTKLMFGMNGKLQLVFKPLA